MNAFNFRRPWTHLSTFSKNAYFLAFSAGVCELCHCVGSHIKCKGVDLSHQPPTFFPTNIKMLELYKCELKDVNPGIFSRLTNLKSLKMDYNKISAIPTGEVVIRYLMGTYWWGRRSSNRLWFELELFIFALFLLFPSKIFFDFWKPL